MFAAKAVVRLTFAFKAFAAFFETVRLLKTVFLKAVFFETVFFMAFAASFTAEAFFARFLITAPAAGFSITPARL